LHLFKQTIPDPLLGPLVEAVVDRVPLAEAFRQITPRDAGLGELDDRVEEIAIVPVHSTVTADPTGQMWLEFAKLLKSELVKTNHSQPRFTSVKRRHLPKPPI
jgi:hypothetical protein